MSVKLGYAILTAQQLINLHYAKSYVLNQRVDHSFSFAELELVYFIDIDMAIQQI